jgi:small subunit ribosomal protein S6e
MKLNVSFPATGCQKLTKENDKHRLQTFYEKCVATEVDTGALGEE